MSEFQREHRYWVIKRKHLTPQQDDECRQLCGRLRYEHIPEVEAVVVESDWPIYEIVWHLVERLATGQRLPFMTDEDPDEMKARLEKAERIADREATGFRAMCEAFERLEKIVGIDTGGGMGPGPALNAVEHIIRQRDALAARLNQSKRPDNCRNELRSQGKPYPKSGCAVCGNGGLVGCPYEDAQAGRKG